MVVNNRHNENSNIYDLLDRLRERPGLYLGVKSISRLRAFLDGYNTAFIDEGLSLSMGDPSFARFDEWVAQQYQQPDSVAGWNDLILWEVDDEEIAVDTFYKLLDKFRAEESEEKFQLAEAQQHIASDKYWWDRLGQTALGVENCAQTGCDRKRIRLSVMCRRHHYEMVKQYPCPFED
jgi:hypothetical protein